MNKSKQDKPYELRSIISCIQWWLNNYNKVPTEVGAFIQRHACIYLGFETLMCMDDLLERARGLLSRHYRTPGTVITGVPPHRPIEDFTTEELLSEIRSRIEYDGD